MKEYRFFRIVRSVLEVLVWLAALFLVVVFARGAGPGAPPQLGVTGSGGFVTTYGMGTTLLALFLIAGSIIGALFLLARFQRLYRYPVQITAQNVEIQYILAKILLSSLQLICALYFILLIVKVHNMTITMASPGFKLLTLFCAIAAGALYGVYLLLARKYK